MLPIDSIRETGLWWLGSIGGDHQICYRTRAKARYPKQFIRAVHCGKLKVDAPVRTKPSRPGHRCYDPYRRIYASLYVKKC